VATLVGYFVGLVTGDVEGEDVEVDAEGEDVMGGGEPREGVTV